MESQEQEIYQNYGFSVNIETKTTIKINWCPIPVENDLPLQQQQYQQDSYHPQQQDSHHPQQQDFHQHHQQDFHQHHQQQQQAYSQQQQDLSQQQQDFQHQNCYRQKTTVKIVMMKFFSIINSMNLIKKANLKKWIIPKK
ncbi:sex-determining region Y protein-like [Panonychus citri]|uniref:sex-determining region Y protein-like n=1 Tax=Panonychus citri TaxID=50023 RepID=UPI0023077EB8|nr:sex-determining region Y protein-like [Panonychus citri]